MCESGYAQSRSGPGYFFFHKSPHHQHFFVIDGLVSDPFAYVGQVAR